MKLYILLFESFHLTVPAILAGKGPVAISPTWVVPPHSRRHIEGGVDQGKAPHCPAEPLPGHHQGVC